MRRPLTVQARISKEDDEWLTLNATTRSAFIQKLIMEARDKEEGRPMDERIKETQELLTRIEKQLEYSLRISARGGPDEIEARGELHFEEKTVARLKAKLAMLQSKKS